MFGCMIFDMAHISFMKLSLSIPDDVPLTVLTVTVTSAGVPLNMVALNTSPN